jgi:hypothetical protein
MQRLAALHDWSGGNHPGVADDLRTLADLLLTQDRPADALPHLQIALDIDDQQQDPRPLMADLTFAIRALELTGDHDDAEQLRAELAELTPAFGHA